MKSTSQMSICLQKHYVKQERLEQKHKMMLKSWGMPKTFCWTGCTETLGELQISFFDSFGTQFSASAPGKYCNRAIVGQTFGPTIASHLAGRKHKELLSQTTI
jgi:hypothetical protein